MLNIHQIKARDLPDLWFQAINDILNKGRRFKVDRGSYAGQTRLEYDYFIGHIQYPGARPMLPYIPTHIGLPNPVDEAYLYGGEGYDRSYIEYVMSARKEPWESYTYGSRLCKAFITDDKSEWWARNSNSIIDKQDIDNKIIFEDNSNKDGKIYINQIEWIIDTYKRFGHRNNQMLLQVAEPSDLTLLDPPCLRAIGTKIQDECLHFFVSFRSWELFSGMPANLAAIQHLKEYMAGEIGVKDGEMIVESKGAHLYGYGERLAKIRCMKE